MKHLPLCIAILALAVSLAALGRILPRHPPIVDLRPPVTPKATFTTNLNGRLAEHEYTPLPAVITQ